MDHRSHLWQQTSFLQEGEYCSLETIRAQADYGGELFAGSPSRKRASIPNPERMVGSAPTFGLTPAEKRVLDLVTDHPMIPREHLSRWLGVSEGRVSRVMQQPHRQMGPGPAKRQTRRHPLQPVRRGHKLHHPQGSCPTPDHTRHLEHDTHFRPAWPTTARGSPHRHVGQTDQTRRRRHLVPLEPRRRSQRQPRQQAAVDSSHC